MFLFNADQGAGKQESIVKMKTFRMIGMALMAVLMCVNFTACSEKGGDDENTEKYSELILGTWKKGDRVTLNFKPDGTLTRYISYGTVGDETQEGWWKISGNKITGKIRVVGATYDYYDTLFDHIIIKMTENYMILKYGEGSSEEIFYRN